MSIDPKMREAAKQLLMRQHMTLGTPMQCQDPAVYAKVAKLLTEPEPHKR